jgi:hypothetical protein
MRNKRDYTVLLLLAISDYMIFLSLREPLLNDNFEGSVELKLAIF